LLFQRKDRIQDICLLTVLTCETGWS
jgi:hypothetical protein